MCHVTSLAVVTCYSTYGYRSYMLFISRLAMDSPWLSGRRATLRSPYLRKYENPGLRIVKSGHVPILVFSTPDFRIYKDTATEV